jgi:hypothetical protein
VERHLISAAIRDKGAYEAFVSRGIEDELSPPAQVVFGALRQFYERDTSAQSANPELIGEYIKLSHPKQAEKLLGVLNELPDTSQDNVVALWLAKKRDAIGKRLSVALSEPGKETEVEQLLEQYNFYKSYDEDDEDKHFHLVSAVDIVAEENNRGRIPLVPKCLNAAIGGGMLRPSNIGIIARMNEGKTGFLVNAVSWACMKGFKTLYLCNEEHPNRTLLRFHSRLADMHIDDVRLRPQEAYDLAVANGYENLTMKHVTPGTMGEIRRLVEKHRPDILIVDQLRNVYMHGAENLVQKLEKGSQYLRDLGNQYGIVTISVTQAGDSATNKPVLDYGDCDSSNTGYHGPLDLLLGIGSNEDLRAQGKRVITIIKNKFTATHQAYTVSFDPYRSKIRSID